MTRHEGITIFTPARIAVIIAADSAGLVLAAARGVFWPALGLLAACTAVTATPFVIVQRTSRRTTPRLLSPCCQRPVDGGPVVYWCTGCGHDVHGSAIDREYQPAPQSTAAGQRIATARCGTTSPAHQENPS